MPPTQCWAVMLRNSDVVGTKRISPALLWMVYGVMIHAVPVIGANLIVSSLALYSAWRAGASSGRPAD